MQLVLYHLDGPKYFGLLALCKSIKFNQSGRSLSWAFSYGPFLSLGLFCWLGVLDAFAQVGLSMMLLQTLTRIHVSAVLFLSQILSSVFLCLSLLSDINPFPNILYSDSVYFWIVFLLYVICAYGYLFFFRTECLSRQ